MDRLIMWRAAIDTGFVSALALAMLSMALFEVFS